MDKIIEIENNVKNNQYRCPNCNSTEIIYDEKIGKLKCLYCKSSFDEEKLKQDDISKLSGRNIGKGAKDIKDSDIVTITCNSCGAEVVINSKEAPIARCHWCRSILSLDNKIENGAIPDVILPFSVTKEEAINLIGKFILKKSFFAKKVFISEFSKDNVMGVFLPYMLVDTNLHCIYEGEGEHLVRRYSVTVGHDKDGHAKEETRYDADLYKVIREFDMEIDDLTVESSKDKSNRYEVNATNNVVNAILPFDTENCIPFKANYLINYTTEKRDMNIKDLENKISIQIGDICRLAINRDLKFFDRGIKWEKEDIKDVGKKYISATLPVWLYTFVSKSKNKEFKYYIALNGRTKEISGSIPIDMKKLIIFSSIIELLSIGISLIIDMCVDSVFFKGIYVLTVIGIVFFLVNYFRYSNKKDRHYYESETKYRLYNIKREGYLIKHKYGLSNSYMYGSNNKRRNG